MSIFKFKFFDIKQIDVPMKVGTDTMVLGSMIDTSGKFSALDIGAGSGVLSLMCAQKNVNLKIDAVELDKKASKECRYNFNKSNFPNEFNSIHINFLNFNTDKKYDLIISNPPFFQSNMGNNDERKSNARHQKSLPKNIFIEKIAYLLLNQGHFWIIVPYEYVQEWINEANKNNLKLNHQTNIRGKEGRGFIRSVLSFSKECNVNIIRELTIRDRSNNYTKEYIYLTKEFHFKNLG